VNLDFSIEHVPDDWEALADAGREVMRNMDTGRWLAGDLALRVEKRYGTDALGQYATDIGIASKSTLKDYRSVAARYESDARAAFPALSWSHYRAALRAKDDAELFLVQAQDNGWPVAELDRRIKAALGQPTTPVKLYDGAGLVWQYADTSRPYLVLHGDVSALKPNMRVVVRVWAEGETNG
jgi:hypothetical protein